MHESELTTPVKLCRPDGTLNPEAVGWSRTPLHTCNLSGRWPRKKRWNYWAVTTENYLFSATVSNVDYSGLVFVYLADFANDLFSETTLIVPLGRGCDLPQTVDADDVVAAIKHPPDGDLFHPVARIVDLSDGRVVAELDDEGLGLTPIAFSPAGDLAYVTSDGRALLIRRGRADPEPLSVDHPVTLASFSADGTNSRRAATTSSQSKASSHSTHWIESPSRIG